MLIYVLICILGMIPCMVTTPSSETCAHPWLKFEDHCYYFHNMTETLRGHSRYDASLICGYFGGKLTSINKPEESKFISNVFKLKWVQQTQHYWIGLSDNATEGDFVWDDGSPFNTTAFNNWRKSAGEPNNYRNEDCVELSWDGKWNDNKCFHRLGFICKRKLGATPPPTPTLPAPPPTSSPRSCEAGWIPWGTSCYGLIMGIPKTWEEARSDCLRRFGDLVIIEKKEELQFLTYQLAKYSSEFWIGLTDLASEGTFSWVNQVPLSKTISNWRKGEPSNDYGVEHCVQMYGKYSPGYWNDNYCATPHDYVCEKQSGTHNCPQGWVTHDDYCYQLNAHPNQRVRWKEAHEACRAFNQPWEDKIPVAEAELVSVVSEDEQKMLHREFMKMGLPGIGNYFWIGLIRNSSKATWYWTDRKTYKYKKWQGAQPSRSFKCAKSSLANENSGWFQASCLEKNNYVCKVKRGQNRCFDPMGMQNYEIPDASITSNSQLSISTPAHAARLYLKAGGTLDGAWCATNTTKRPYLHIDFGSVKKLTYMAMQGKSNSKAMVTAFYFTYSLDGVSYDTYGNYPPARFYKFRSQPQYRSKNLQKVMNLPLPADLVARHVRVYPLDWYMSCCLRLEFYGCSHTEENQKCGLGWTEDKRSGHCYKFNTQRTSLDAASGLCAAQGAKLLSITSMGEKEFVEKQLQSLSGRYSDYWIGLTDLDHEGMFSWLDESPLTMTNWYKNNPRLKDVIRNCVTIRASDGFWVNVDCTSYRTFICKRTYKRNLAKRLLSNNWRTDTAFYWPLEDISNRKVIGTVPGVAYGAFPHKHFNHDTRHYLSFDGKKNYIEISGLGNTCAANPDSSECTHGITVSFLFNYASASMKAKYILDTLGQKGRNTVGYSVYIKMNRIYVVLRGHEIYYTAYTTVPKNKWTHFVFRWSTLDGLKLYINGFLRYRRSYGSRNPAYIKKQMVTSLFIGRSASSLWFTKIQLLSLAIFDRLLSTSEIISIYKAELGKCAWGQIGHGSYCYEFNVTALNYVDALSSCQRNGGNLISVHSPVEQAFLSLSVGVYGLNSETWIGFNANKQVFVYNWTDGSAVTYTFWGAFEPNNFRGRGESCVNTVSAGWWNDNLCFLRKSFACKYERGLARVAGGAAEKVSEKSYTVTIYFFQTRTFGCTLSKKVELEEVFYGNKQEKCHVDYETAKKIVQQDCAGPRCLNIRATDHYFNKTNPCHTKRLATKRLIVRYKCVDDESKINPCADETYSVYNKNGACYKLYVEKLNVDEAAKVCKGDGGALASISGYYEELFLTTLMSKLYEITDVWIGLKYKSESREFSWSNGQKVTYTNWFNQYPDPRVGSDVKVSIHRGSDRFIFWNTANGTEKLPFFCRVAGKSPTAQPPTKAPTGKCGKAWSRYNNYCYYANNQSMTHPTASFMCKRYGANLVSITSAKENIFLYKLLANQTSRWFSTWIGLTNEAIVKGYNWLDKTPLSYINWYTTTPYTGSRHLCVAMNSGGRWWDLPCHSRYPSICKRKVGSARVKPTNTPVTTKTYKPGSCQKDWRYFNGSCYYFSSVPQDFHFASQNCTNMSSRLASILSRGENDFINTAMKSTFKMSILDPPVYIGMHDMSSESGWEWTDESLVKYINWEENQPDDWHGEEDCVSMRYTGKWNDVSCSLKLRFVCKKHNDTVVKPKPKPKPNTGFCKYPWVLYGSKCYLFKLEAKDRRNQENAKKYCRDIGSDLVSIHHNYVNAFLLSRLREATYPVYIGFADYMKEGTFAWTDQTSVDFTNWYLRQPSRYRNEDCVELFPFYLYRGHWNDIHCEKQLPFICQKNSETTGTPPGPPKSDCPQGYEKYASDCYRVFRNPATWNDALKECQKTKGDLVSFHDPYHQAFVFSKFVTEQVNETWVGLHKKANERLLHWSDGSSLDYHHWKNGQIVYPIKDAEVCVSQVFSEKLDGRWIATSTCSSKLPYTCKITREPKNVVQYEGSCQQDWTMYDKTCYRYFKTERASWPEAREKCKRFGGDLATVDSKEIQSILLYLVRSSFATVWIGLNDREQEHIWRWSSGRPYSVNGYSNWGDLEPNDNSGVENCVEIYSATGNWNDLPCRHRHPFICEHSLQCRTPLVNNLTVVENRHDVDNQTVADATITASNFTDSFFPRFAKLKSTHNGLQTSWCTGITDGKQNLTINLGEMMHITIIQTQGLFPYHVISYKLFYSDDGINWKAYTEMKGPNPEPRILPGNEKGSQIEGVSVDLHAVYVRFMPVLFKLNLNKNLVCLRVELFGCKSVCRKRLNGGNYSSSSNSQHIKNLRASLTQMKPWCSLSNDAKPYVKIDFQHPIKINRVLAYGIGTTGYALESSDDGITYKKYDGQHFSRVHDFDTPLVTRYVKVLPLGDANVKCLKLELYGCEHECDVPFGMESGEIPDVLITTSSHRGDHNGYKGRLNAQPGNYWRPIVNDKSQFFQIDFTQKARITHVATQGCEADMYVQSYYLQWSNDEVFWHHSKELIYGNIESNAVKKIELKESLTARYLRINPSTWNNAICLRVEVYGCTIDKFIVPSKPHKSVFVGNLRLIDEEYTDELTDPTSTQFKALETKVQRAVSEIYSKDTEFKESVVEVIINGFKRGSVVAEFTVIITNAEVSTTDPVEILEKEIKNGRVGKLKVDVDLSTYGKETAFNQRSEVVYESGLSEGGKIGLLVFFFLMIAVVLISGAIFYLKRSNRGFKLQFAHKNFDNPVDFAPQEYGDNVHILSAHD